MSKLLTFFERVPWRWPALTTALIVIGINLVLADGFPTLITIACAIAAALLFLIVQKHPLVAVIAYLILFAYVSIAGHVLVTSTGCIGIGLLIAVSTIASYKISIPFAISFTFLGILEPGGKFEPSAGLLPWTVFIGFIVVSGRLIRSRVKALDAQKIIEKRNTAAMIDTLHDSVATALSDISLRAEALSVAPDICNAHDKLAAISADARTASTDVRSLIALLRKPEFSSAEDADAVGFPDLLQDLTRRLQSEGMQVIQMHDEQNPRLSLTEASVLRRILREVGTNIVKYGRKDGTVLVVTESDERSLKLKIQNEYVSRTESESAHSSHVGLSRINQLAAQVGASALFHSDGEQWATEITFAAR